MIVHLDLVRD